MPTPWTAETLWPAQGEQIVAASLLARKVRLEFELVARVILHQALHYILGSPESSGYPACPILNRLKGSEFVRKIKRLGKRQGVTVRLSAKRGKGSHATLHYGEARTVIQDPKRESYPPGLFTPCSISQQPMAEVRSFPSGTATLFWRVHGINSLPYLSCAKNGNKYLDSSVHPVYTRVMEHEPQTLQEAIIYFADPGNCLDYLAKRRWPDGVVCPTCGSGKVSFVPSRRVWQCKTVIRRHSSASRSAPFSRTLRSHWTSGCLPCGCSPTARTGVSSYEISRATGISQKSSWFMLQRIRLALQGEAGGKLSGEVEVDETFIGGKARNMHASVKARRITGTGGKDKTAVLGVLQRGGTVRTAVIHSTKKKVLSAARQGACTGWLEALQRCPSLLRRPER